MNAQTRYEQSPLPLSPKPSPIQPSGSNQVYVKDVKLRIKISYSSLNVLNLIVHTHCDLKVFQVICIVVVSV